MEDKLTDLIYAQLGLGGLLLAFVAWTFFGLTSEFAKLRREVAYEVNRDLLAKRFEAYGALWAQMKRLALYAGTSFGRADAQALERELSEWYFSKEGGLLLTREAREFYFALQDTVRATAALPDWSCPQRPTNTLSRFSTLLDTVVEKEGKFHACARLLAAKTPERMDPDEWRAACGAIAKDLQNLAIRGAPEACDSIYCAVQQISSILRTRLASEVRSRLAVELPG
jgi:hypothetical protein